jgi:hypothetical protein
MRGTYLASKPLYALKTMGLCTEMRRRKYTQTTTWPWRKYTQTTAWPCIGQTLARGKQYTHQEACHTYQATCRVIACNLILGSI